MNLQASVLATAIVALAASGYYPAGEPPRNNTPTKAGDDAFKADAHARELERLPDAGVQRVEHWRWSAIALALFAFLGPLIFRVIKRRWDIWYYVLFVAVFAGTGRCI